MTAGVVATLKNRQISGSPMFKRCFDISVSLILLPILLPLKLTIIIAIKLDSPGPVFYRGVRSGWHGKPFRIFKFRTMVPDAERLGGGTTALGDARITQVGQVLRRYKLDEMPQLSVVGEVASGEEAVQLLRSLKPDVVLMDMQIPGIGGLEATRRILKCDPDISVLVVIPQTDEPFPAQLLDAGASG